MNPFKEGSFKIALKSGVKIVPVAIHGTRELFERQFPRIKANNVTISYGIPVDPKTLDKEEQKHIAGSSRIWYERLKVITLPRELVITTL